MAPSPVSLNANVTRGHTPLLAGQVDSWRPRLKTRRLRPMTRDGAAAERLETEAGDETPLLNRTS